MPISLEPRPSADREEAGERHVVVDTPGCRHRLWLRTSDAALPLAILLAPATGALQFAAVDAARCLVAGLPTPAASALHPTRFQRQRLGLLLDILDADLGGASNREIGTRLIYSRLAGMPADAWKASNERRRTQRLIGEARAMTRDGYRRLLRPG